MSGSDYLTHREAAAYLGISPDHLKEKRRTGLFVEGVHFFRPPGMRLRWKREALVAFIENRPAGEDAGAVPLARGRRVA